MLKLNLLMLIFMIGAACGSKKNHSDSPSNIQNEIKLSLGTHSECGRAKEIRGSNSLYQWTKAEIGDLQKITISTDSKTIDYAEARASSLLEGSSPYQYVSNSSEFFFKTTTKSLKFAFNVRRIGVIENDRENKEYVVGFLTYDDGSGYGAFFLCPKI